MLQVQKISREVIIDPSETTRRAPCEGEMQAYLLGALHDASLNKKKRYRFTQKGIEWLTLLKKLFQELGYKSWIYREGNREVYTLETLAKFLDFGFDPLTLSTDAERAAYIRGFFDAEGGVPRNAKADFYIQLVQKDRTKIEKLVDMLDILGISTGKIHNPSERVDPNYWRTYVSWRSHSDFASKIGSWHPLKAKILQTRVMI
ncbi:MAG: LAGLIDADG family homing endonuclease [bacterium]|nr:LAGLIDADG family homing endonuclease [bacterium]